MYYLLVFFGCFIFSGGLLFIKRPFQRLALETVSLLNNILDSDSNEDIRQRKLISGVIEVMKLLLLFILLISITLLLALLPVKLLLHYNSQISPDTSSIYFYGILIFGFIPLFLIPTKKEHNGYSGWSKLLHHLVLDNYNVSKSLFNFEKKFFRKKTSSLNPQFVVVSGLARSGTTAFTQLLHQAAEFHSLDYANMPFLMSVNLWRIVYRPKKNILKERSHDDKVLHGLNTIEALEEYFFKVFMNDSFVEKEKLRPHEVDQKTYNDYLIYQNLIRNKQGVNSTYLTKNNNFILRYESLRNHNPDFTTILLFRNPAQHAASLLNQHKRFLKIQHDDPFSLDYMNWLGHHEFGLNHKPFDFGNSNWNENLDLNAIGYWIQVWINYYKRVLELPENNKLVLIDYSDFLENPKKIFEQLSDSMKKTFTTDHISNFDNPDKEQTTVDEKLLHQATIVYEKLKLLKLKI